MSKKNNANVLKTLILFLGILLVGLLVYTYTIYRGSQENLKALQQEKKQLNSTLNNLQQNYDQMLKEHSTLTANFQKEKKRIAQLKKNLQDAETSVKALRKFKVQVELLQMEKKRLMVVNDSLLAQNKQLQSTIDSTSSMLAHNKKRNDSLSLENQTLVQKIAKAAVLKIIAIKAQALKQRNNGTTKPTDRARKTDQIRVSFSLSKNELVPIGEKKLFLQVIDPKHNLAGEKHRMTFQQKILNYSAIYSFYYTGKNQKIQANIPCQAENLIAGKYLVNIFNGPKLLGSTSLKLR